MFSFFLLLFNVCCNKLVQIPEPISSVTANQVFSTEATATEALLGIYSSMSGYANQSELFSNLMTTYFPGLSADEITDRTAGNEASDFFLSNSLAALNSGNVILGNFWQPAYYDIYEANAIISGVQASTGITTAEKNQLVGEAKFIRAFCYFYLTNLFGDLPLVLNTDFNQTVLLPKTPSAQIYQQILSDLLDAQSSLPPDYLISNGMPIRANKWAATALLARVYLFLPNPNYTSADSAASAVINSRQFNLVPLPLIAADAVPDSDAFLANSKEAILQLQTPNTNPYATWEGYFFNPQCATCGPNGAWLTNQLLGAFEPNDLRRTNWVDSIADYTGAYYWYPYKYKVYVGSAGNTTENYTLLRFAEQYLIRAEGEANLNQLGAAINDLDTIRTRAGLPNLSSSMPQSEVLAAVQQEYRIEFFAEWGHRWFDLRRWGIAIQTLKAISYKSSIDSTQLLYPISTTELQTDPNLKQNPGY
jgi:hypothetical protein